MENIKKVKEKIDFIWKVIIKPRETIRNLINNDMNIYYYLLVYLFGISSFLGSTPKEEYIINDLGIFLLVSTGILIGLISMSLSASIFYISSKILKGNTNFEKVKIAILWSEIPTLIVIPLVVIITFVNADNFKFVNAFVFENPMLSTIYGLIIVIQIGARLISLRNLTIMLSEINGFSLVKSILTVVLPYALLIGGSEIIKLFSSI